jgi:hypothetical protein
MRFIGQNPMNPLEDCCWEPEKDAQFSDQIPGGGALKHSQIEFFWTASFLFVSDRVDSLIGPSGLLLVVSHLPAVPSFSFIGGVGRKLATETFDVRNIFAGSHTQSCWRCMLCYILLPIPSSKTGIYVMPMLKLQVK